MSRPSWTHLWYGRDVRSIGHADRWVASVRRDPSLFPALINGLRHADELIRMRLADAAEKLTDTSPHWLQPVNRRLMSLARGGGTAGTTVAAGPDVPRLELSQKNRGIGYGNSTSLSRSLSDIDRSTAANDPQSSASFSVLKNPQPIPVNTPPVFPGLRPAAGCISFASLRR